MGRRADPAHGGVKGRGRHGAAGYCPRLHSRCCHSPWDNRDAVAGQGSQRVLGPGSGAWFVAPRSGRGGRLGRGGVQRGMRGVWRSEGDGGGSGVGPVGGGGGAACEGAPAWSRTPPTSGSTLIDARHGMTACAVALSFIPFGSLCYCSLCLLFLPWSGLVLVGPPKELNPCSCGVQFGSKLLGHLFAPPLCTPVELQPHPTFPNQLDQAIAHIIILRKLVRCKM